MSDMEFDLPTDKSSIIKVIGVGGGGSNAVNHMYNQGIKGVDFIVCNTDRQALDMSPVPFRVQLGPNLTEGRGAGMQPEVGMHAAMENIDEIKDLLNKETKMVFITAGMGGGTGTGAAPVIARVAKELGILTVGIVTVPFNFEGRKRRQQAENGLEAMRDNVDTLLIINNERLRDFGKSMSLSQAFGHADNILTVAAKGIAEVISVTGIINVDFNDVNTVLRNSGRAIMGSAVGEGEHRASEAVQNALISPLLNDNDIHGAQYILLNITYGDKEVMMDEISEITDYIQDAAGATADVIWGHGCDPSLGDKLSITLIATGFSPESTPLTGFEKSPERKLLQLNEELEAVKEIKSPLSEPTSTTSSQDEVNEESIKSDKIQIKHVVELESNECEAKTSDEIEIPSNQDNSMDMMTGTVSEKKTFNLFDDMENDTVESEKTTLLNDEAVNDEESGDISWDMEIINREENVELKNNNPLESVENSKSEQINTEDPENTKIVRHLLDDDTVEMEIQKDDLDLKDSNSRSLSANDFQQKNQERFSMIEEFTSRIKHANGIEEFENEPAYQRKNIELDETMPSEDQKVSRFGLSDDGNGKSNLRNNNFLHDNVD